MHTTVSKVDKGETERVKIWYLTQLLKEEINSHNPSQTPSKFKVKTGKEIQILIETDTKDNRIKERILWQNMTIYQMDEKNSFDVVENIC